MTDDFVKARRVGPVDGVFVTGFIYDLPRAQVEGEGWEILSDPSPEPARVTEPAPAKPANTVKRGKTRGK